MALRGLALLLRDLGILLAIGIGAGGIAGFIGVSIYYLVKGAG